MPMHGPYEHADGALEVKAFVLPDGRRRSFSVLVARGLDAGGVYVPERNGLAVVDLDNRVVVLDGHVPMPVGPRIPSPEQAGAMRSVMAMGWGEFSAFCGSHPRLRRGNVPDIADRVPAAPPRVPLEDAEAVSRLSRMPLAEVSPGVLAPCVPTGWDADGLDADTAVEALSALTGEDAELDVLDLDGSVVVAVTAVGDVATTFGAAHGYASWVRSGGSGIHALDRLAAEVALAVASGPHLDGPSAPRM